MKYKIKNGTFCEHWTGNGARVRWDNATKLYKYTYMNERMRIDSCSSTCHRLIDDVFRSYTWRFILFAAADGGAFPLLLLPLMTAMWCSTIMAICTWIRVLLHKHSNIFLVFYLFVFTIFIRIKIYIYIFVQRNGLLHKLHVQCCTDNNNSNNAMDQLIVTYYKCLILCRRRKYCGLCQSLHIWMPLVRHRLRICLHSHTRRYSS